MWEFNVCTPWLGQLFLEVSSIIPDNNCKVGFILGSNIKQTPKLDQLGLVKSQHLLGVGSNVGNKTKQSGPNAVSIYLQIDREEGGC
jgi:hypothetical protein